MFSDINSAVRDQNGHHDCQPAQNGVATTDLPKAASPFMGGSAIVKKLLVGIGKDWTETSWPSINWPSIDNDSSRYCMVCGGTCCMNLKQRATLQDTNISVSGWSSQHHLARSVGWFHWLNSPIMVDPWLMGGSNEKDPIMLWLPPTSQCFWQHWLRQHLWNERQAGLTERRGALTRLQLKPWRIAEEVRHGTSGSV